MKISAKGQVTIPARIREQFGMLPDTDVAFSIEGGEVVLRKIRGDGRRGKKMIAAMAGKATNKTMTTDEIMKLTRGED